MKKILLPLVLVLFAWNVFGESTDISLRLEIVVVREQAEAGNAHAQYKLGAAYANGIGVFVLKDYKQAVTWYSKAANQGHPGALFNLGKMYYDGKGVLKDNVAAYAWFSLAAYYGDLYGKGAKLRDIKPLIPSGGPAAGTLFMVGGRIVVVRISSPGYGYTSAPQVRFVDTSGAGNGAQGTTNMRPSPVRGQAVSGVTITNPGQNYNPATTYVEFVGDLLAKEMTPEQIAEAQKLAKELLKQIEAEQEN